MAYVSNPNKRILVKPCDRLFFVCSAITKYFNSTKASKLVSLNAQKDARTC